MSEQRDSETGPVASSVSGAASGPEVFGSRNPKSLSCTNCRFRKVKCNRVHPCAPCQRSNRECVFPKQRQVPKSRPGRRAANTSSRDDEVLRRLRVLESLLVQSGRELPGMELPSPQQQVSDAVEDPIDFSSPNLSSEVSQATRSSEMANNDDSLEKTGQKYLSSNFWSRLGNEVEGLKQLLENSSDDDDDNTQESPMSSNSTNYSLPVEGFLFEEQPYGSPISSTNGRSSPAFSSALFSIYFDNVDPVFKVLHKPSVHAALLEIAPSVSDSGVAPTQRVLSLEALLFAMHFAAVTSLTDDQCIALVGQQKHMLQAEYKSSTENAFTKANFVTTTDLTVLQALIVYLVALRAYNKSQSNTTLFAVAVSIAQSLGLHRDGDGKAFSPFEAQMRRRAWWHLIMLDARSSEDRDCDPVIAGGSFNTLLPSNVNDFDFGPHSTDPVTDAIGFTQMTFALVSYRVSNLIKRMNYVPPVNNIDGVVPDFSLHAKIDLIRKCKSHFETLYYPYCDPSVPIQWIVSMNAPMLVLRMWLILRYPIQKQESAPAVNISPQECLRLAITNLEIMDLLGSADCTKQFAWFFGTYVQWHPLAVALAELCVQTKGPLVDRAWVVIDKAYASLGDRIADTRGGRLWRPIKKLHNKAQAARTAAHNGAWPNTNVESAINFDDPNILPELPKMSLESNENQINDSMVTIGPNLDLNIGFPDMMKFDMDSFPPAINSSWPSTIEGNPNSNWGDWSEFLMDASGDNGLLDPYTNFG